MTTLIIVLCIAIAVLVLTVWLAYRRWLKPLLAAEPDQEEPDGFFSRDDHPMAFEHKLSPGRAPPVRVHDRTRPLVKQADLYNALAASVAGEEMYADLPRLADGGIPVSEAGEITVPDVPSGPELQGRAKPAGKTGWEEKPQSPIFDALAAAWSPAVRAEVKGAPPWELLDRKPSPARLPRRIPPAAVPAFERHPVPVSDVPTDSEWLRRNMADLFAWSADPDGHAIVFPMGAVA